MVDRNNIIHSCQPPLLTFVDFKARYCSSPSYARYNTKILSHRQCKPDRVTIGAEGARLRRNKSVSFKHINWFRTWREYVAKGIEAVGLDLLEGQWAYSQPDEECISSNLWRTHLSRYYSIFKLSTRSRTSPSLSISWTMLRILQGRCRVLRLEKTYQIQHQGQFLQITGRGMDREWKRLYDAFFASTGYDSRTGLLDFPGKSSFQGPLLHSHVYFDSKDYNI